jgi:hypothetical protein
MGNSGEAHDPSVRCADTSPAKPGRKAYFKHPTSG